jgi:hypothetical protein
VQLCAIFFNRTLVASLLSLLTNDLPGWWLVKEAQNKKSSKLAAHPHGYPVRGGGGTVPRPFSDNIFHLERFLFFDMFPDNYSTNPTGLHDDLSADRPDKVNLRLSPRVH